MKDERKTKKQLIAELTELRQQFREPQHKDRARQVAVYRIAALANSPLTLDAVYRQIHETIAGLMSCENFYIALYDPETNFISLPYFVDEFDTYDGPYAPGKGLTEYVLRKGEPLLIDEAGHQRLIERGEAELIGPSSPIWLGVPLKSNAETFGVMVVQHYRDANAYGEHEKALLTFVSDQVASAIERKRTEEELRYQSDVDEDAHERALARAIERLAAVLDLPPILIALELDSMKRAGEL